MTSERSDIIKFHYGNQKLNSTVPTENDNFDS